LIKIRFAKAVFKSSLFNPAFLKNLKSLLRSFFGCLYDDSVFPEKDTVISKHFLYTLSRITKANLCWSRTRAKFCQL